MFHPQVQGHLKNLMEEHFKSDLEAAMRDPILFGDYKTALNESEPRVYEDIQDYDTAKGFFQVSTAPRPPAVSVCQVCEDGEV